jgi:hypothetical protein
VNQHPSYVSKNHIIQFIKSSWKFTNVNDGHLNSCNIPHAHRLPYGGFLCAYIGKLCCNFPHYAHKNTPWDQWIVTTIHARESSHQLIMPNKVLRMGGHSLKFGPTLHFLKWAGPYFGNGPPPPLGPYLPPKRKCTQEENNDKNAIHPCLVKWEKRTDLGYLSIIRSSHHTEVCFHDSVHRKLVCNSIHKSGDAFVIPLGKQSIDLGNRAKLSSFCTSSGDSFVGLCIPKQGYCV